MSTTVKAKGKKEKPSANTLAFREYERVSYYLATIGDFDFICDADARSAFFDGDQEHEINLMTAYRIAPNEDFDDRRIPKGDFIDGLAIRTKQLEKELANQEKADSQFSKKGKS